MGGAVRRRRKGRRPEFGVRSFSEPTPLPRDRLCLIGHRANVPCLAERASPQDALPIIARCSLSVSIFRCWRRSAASGCFRRVPGVPHMALSPAAGGTTPAAARLRPRDPRACRARAARARRAPPPERSRTRRGWCLRERPSGRRSERRCATPGRRPARRRRRGSRARAGSLVDDLAAHAVAVDAHRQRDAPLAMQHGIGHELADSQQGVIQDLGIEHALQPTPDRLPRRRNPRRIPHHLKQELHHRARGLVDLAMIAAQIPDISAAQLRGHVASEQGRRSPRAGRPRACSLFNALELDRDLAETLRGPASPPRTRMARGDQRSHGHD
ncbi:MAG: hypothetical protein QOD86_635 [Miltoncostaeaceae bacterium]|nr:hypothetical protein [Miltoncostaeaceae bacterium]